MTKTKMTDPRTVFALDPGKSACGVALFVNERLKAAALLKADDTYLLGEEVESWVYVQRTRFGLPDMLDTVVCESQQVYPGMRSRNPNDLLPLAYLCGAVQARLPSYQRLMPLPRTWKGALRKEAFTRRILSRLAPDEMQIVKEIKCAPSVLHNAVDAIGLALWTMGAVRTDEPNEVV